MPLAVPPDRTCSKPPLDTTVALVVPPAATVTVPEEVMMTPVLVCPLEMVSVWPLETVVMDAPVLSVGCASAGSRGV